MSSYQGSKNRFTKHNPNYILLLMKFIIKSASQNPSMDFGTFAFREQSPRKATFLYAQRTKMPVHPCTGRARPGSGTRSRYFIKFGFIIFVGTIVNCLTIQFPPVSVTGTKTAAEKQIIGEQTELEKDVWMISSAKTTSNVDIQQETKEKAAKQEVQKENAYTYKGFAIMDAFAQELAELKKDGVVGENNNGLLSSLLNEESVEITPEQKDKYKPDPENRSYKVLVETVKQINQARHYIIEGYILNQKRIYPEFNPDKKELLKNQKSKYQGLAVKGEFIQQDTGEWVKKK